MQYKLKFKAMDAKPRMYALSFEHRMIAENHVGEDGKFSDEWQDGKLQKLGLELAKKNGLWLYDEDDAYGESVFVGTLKQIIKFEEDVDTATGIHDGRAKDWVLDALEEENTIRKLDPEEVTHVNERIKAGDSTDEVTDLKNKIKELDAAIKITIKNNDEKEYVKLSKERNALTRKLIKINNKKEK